MNSFLLRDTTWPSHYEVPDNFRPESEKAFLRVLLLVPHPTPRQLRAVNLKNSLIMNS